MLRSPICEVLGIEKPVFQGGMAWIADASLAAAVSEAGGLGIIAAMNANADWLREQIHELRTKTTKPFGVNVMLMSPFADEVARVVVEEKVPVVVTGAGNPTKYMKDWVAAGIKVIPVCASVGLARMVERAGACAVVAEGGESGGHVGEATTMALVPQVVDAVKIPVIAAGGIADGRGVAAAFMLGAQGVQVGTRFLVATECTVSEEYKERVLKAKDISTIVTGRSTGHAVRCLKTPFTNAFARRENEGAPVEELEQMGAGALRKAAKDGNYEEGSFMCGQIAGLVHERQSAAEIVNDLVDGAEQLLKGASAWVA
ncbi:enoyl-[acyl-carrier-protein] reductase FabK [Enorma phocaeensis]|uniref:enoyl-[acyl-carrier-protein] reductase FabK n=1 Tax=Enorma phocaeensis TaxID=1871019 RepID=UPI002352C52E|nr:enoyl-[acyl-carrier-protein] reductase FabK [Enorma phocaeensis]